MHTSEAVGWLAVAPSSTALFTDFDGTLAPIVGRPEDARPVPGVPALLKRLASRLLVVAVTSGRPVAWLAQQLELSDAGTNGDAVEAYGLHGLERWSGHGVELDEAAVEGLPAIARALREAVAAGVPGVDVEDKQYGVTLHWRNASEPLAAAKSATELARRLAQSGGLVTRSGKASIELVPPGGVDKGTVVRRRVETSGAHRVCYVGDDVSDLLAFIAIDRMVSDTAVAGLKVAVAGQDVPTELIERADVVLDGPAAAVGLLTELAERLEAGRG